MANALELIDVQFINWLETSGLSGRGYTKKARQSLFTRLRNSLERYIPTEYDRNIDDFYQALVGRKTQGRSTSNKATALNICEIWLNALNRELDRDMINGGLYAHRIQSVVTAVRNLDAFVDYYL